MNKIALLCDSSADITQAEATDLGIYVVRMPIIVDGYEFKEEVEISDAEFIDAMRCGKRVTTTQPSFGELMTMWETLLQDYDEVFYLPLSNALSGTCHNAIQLAERFDGKVTVVDSEYVCYPVIVQLQVAKEMFEKGYTTKEVKQKLETESEMFAILIPEDLVYLKNGGRISAATAALGGLLKIHPLLKVEHGAIDVQDKVRTLSKAHKEGIRVVTDGILSDDYIWMIIDADNRKASDELKKELEAVTGQVVVQRVFKPIIMCHVGPGTIGFGRIKKLKY